MSTVVIKRLCIHSELFCQEPEESTGPKKAKMMKKDEEVEVKKEKLSRNTRANVKSKGGKGKAAKVSVKSNIKTPTTPTPRKTPKQKKEIKGEVLLMLLYIITHS